MIFKFICAVLLTLLCFHSDKELRKATENKDLYSQIQQGIYLIIGIIVFTSF